MVKQNKKFRKHLRSHKNRYLIIIAVLFFLLIFSGGIIAGYFYFGQDKQKATVTEIETEKNIYIEFLFEVYDKIQENYWNKISDEELTNIFKLGSEKLTQKPQVLEPANKEGLDKLVTGILENMNEEQKKEFSAQLANLVLVNLKPFGRSGLYTPKEEEELKNKVENVNPETGEVELTIYTKLVHPKILHLYIKRMSPTTLNDLKIETEKFDNIEGLDTLIIDLRGNIGGSLDILLYLLGPFIGKGQYAFELFQQEEYKPFKTEFGWLPSLVRYKKVVVLIDENSQSSAEVMAVTLKKYNVGVLVGTKTKGWGTIEKVYEVENQIDPDKKYSVFLVNHLTLRADNQSIEENGIEPVININDPKWKEQLLAYFNYNELIKAVEEVWNISPADL